MATSGVGSALCPKLASAGTRLYLTGRDNARVESLARAVGGETIVTDVTSLREVEAALDEVVQTEGRIDGVVQCAGSLVLKPAHAITEEHWGQTLRTNLDSDFFTFKAAGVASLERNDASGLGGDARARPRRRTLRSGRDDRVAPRARAERRHRQVLGVDGGLATLRGRVKT